MAKYRENLKWVSQWRSQEDIEKTLCFGHCQLKKALEENQENNRHIPIPNGLKDINFIFTPNTLAIIIS